MAKPITPPVDKHSQTHTQRASHSTPKRALAILALLAGGLLLPEAASAQLRVDTTLYSSSGSCANCDLSGKRMNGMTLKDANFAGSLFNNSNLSGGKLHGTDLSGAHFRNARLYGVRGTHVTMRGAVFEDATLTGATLTHSTLHSANLHRAELERGTFHDNDFQAANLSGASLSGANLSRSNFKGATLDNADLSGAVLADSQLSGVSFGMARMDGTVLDGADLSGSDLSLATGLTQAQFDTACGDMHTRLPDGLDLAYCEGTNIARAATTAVASAEMRAATRALDRALGDVEALMSATRDRAARARLQRIHRDLVQSRAALQQ